MLIVLSIVALAVGSFLVIGFWISAPSHSGALSDHFDGKRFINAGNIQAKGLKEVFQWMIQRKQGPWSKKLDTHFGEKPDQEIHHGIKITFVNHSTFLIQLDGVNMLTDPIWSERTSPFQFAGPVRMKQPCTEREISC